MATNTYVALDTQTIVGTSTTSITFTGISGAYTDLRLIINSQNQNSTNQPYIQFNSDTGTGTTNYSTTSVQGNGSTTASNRHTNNIGWYPVPGPGVGTTGNFQPWIVEIMDYSNTTTFKSGQSRFNNSASILSMNSHLWRSTAAITSITITAEAGAGYLVPNSTFSLYGIAAASAASPKATGGTIYEDSTYWYHAFASSGTFTPNQALTCDYLVVAGGGGGGSHNSNLGGSSGGGAGGLRSTVTATGGGGSLESPLSLIATAYAVTVGAGGAGAAGSAADGSVGNNSVLSTITSAGGGIGRKYTGPKFVGGDGGSGGGGSGYSAAPSGVVNPGGAATPAGQGYAGGGGWYSTSVDPRGGGGGGAGSVGGTASDSAFGVGGSGLAVAITGNLVTYAGGGAGPGWTTSVPGGSGGGGAGIYNGIGVAGAAGLGAGGGGGSTPGGGNGGSGVVIIRYLKA
jgi:hypothetical protein